MTVAHLSQEWLDLRAQLGAALPARTGVTVKVQTVVAKTPAGDVAFVESYEDGRVAGAKLGADDTAEVTINLTHADSLAIARGELDVHVGFMQGRVKVVGDTGTFMELVPVLGSEEHRKAVAELASHTAL